MKIDWNRVDDARRYADQDESDLDSAPDRLDDYQLHAPDLDDRVPPPPKGKGTGGGDISVSTTALKTFAGNLRQVRGVLTEAREKLQGVDVRPGAFYDANQLRVKTLGGESSKKGLVPTTLEYLTNVIGALQVIADEVEGLVRDYDTAEEFNGLTAVDLGEHMTDSTRYIGKATGLPGNSLIPQEYDFGNGSGGDGSGGDGSGGDGSGDDGSGDDGSGDGSGDDESGDKSGQD